MGPVRQIDSKVMETGALRRALWVEVWVIPPSPNIIDYAIRMFGGILPEPISRQF